MVSQVNYSPIAGPDVLAGQAFWHNGFFYTLFQLNMSDSTAYSVGGLLQILKYKIINNVLFLMASIPLYGIDANDSANGYVDSLDFYNSWFYVNVSGAGAKPGIYSFSAKQLESGTPIFPKVTFLPSPTDTNSLSIGPDGIAYLSGNTAGGGIATCYMMIATVKPNGSLTPFQKTTAPNSHVAAADGTAAQSFRVVPVVGGYLSCEYLTGGQTEAVATKINPNTGQWLTYLAPQWISFVNRFGLFTPDGYTGPMYITNSGYVIKIVDNDIVYSVFAPSGSFPNILGNSDTVAWASSTFGADQTTSIQQQGWIRLPPL